MAEDRKIAVTFRKAVSDGNYGTESAEVSLEWFVPDEDDSNEDRDAAEELLVQARAHVHAELSHSPSANVRRAVEVQADRERVIVAADEEDPF